MGILGIWERATPFTIPIIIYNPRPHRMRRVWPQQDTPKRPPASFADEPTRSHASFIWWRLVTRVRLVLLVASDLLPHRHLWEASGAPLAGDGHGTCTASSAPLPPSRCQESNQLILTVSRQASAENRVSSPQFKVIQLTTRRNGEASHNQEKQSGLKDQRAVYLLLLIISTRNLQHRVE